MMSTPTLSPTMTKPGSTTSPFGTPTAHPIDYPSDYRPPATVNTSAGSTSGVSATQVHQAIVAILIMGAFVYMMTLLAGTSPAAGKIIGALFVGLLLIQGAGHVNPFVEWVNRHPLTPTTP